LSQRCADFFSKVAESRTPSALAVA
jgi:hypothetical protein